MGVDDWEAEGRVGVRRGEVVVGRTLPCRRSTRIGS
jgi:hypothetical protein